MTWICVGSGRKKTKKTDITLRRKYRLRGTPAALMRLEDAVFIFYSRQVVPSSF